MFSSTAEGYYPLAAAPLIIGHIFGPNFVEPHHWLFGKDAAFFLSWRGKGRGEWWSALSYQFVHRDSAHAMENIKALVVHGMGVYNTLGALGCNVSPVAANTSLKRNRLLTNAIHLSLYAGAGQYIQPFLAAVLQRRWIRSTCVSNGRNGG